MTSSVSGYNYTAFDAMGRVTAYNQQTAGQLYTMSATYNKGGLMLSETYPSGKVIETQYDGGGRIAGVKKQGASGFIAGAASSDAANRLQYTAHGAVSAMKLGNGLWEHVNFNSRLQPTQIGLGTSSTTSGTLQLDYGYGASASVNNGNITSQTITAPGLNVTQNYSYDQVNRLLTASEGTNWTQTYGYDVYGNRWVASGYKPNPTLTPQAQSAFNAANNRLTTALGFNYDLVGNLTSDPTTAAGAMVYDAENRQTSYTKASVTTSYAYDGDGRRVKKTDSTGTTVFVYNAAGQLVAEYTDAATSGTVQMSYLTTDHLGSTRVVTDGNQVVKARHDYLPFGEEIESSIGGRGSVTGYAAVDSTRQRFTSKERDTESGLDYFGMRYYGSAQGRFTSVDPVLQSSILQDPQSWNRSAYAFNNPMMFVDPTGGENEPANEEEQKKKPHRIRFEVLGKVKILGKNVTVYVATGQTKEYKEKLLNRVQGAADLINLRADELSSEDKKIIGNLTTIADPGANIGRNDQFYAIGIKGVRSDEVFEGDQVDVESGTFFNVQTGHEDDGGYLGTVLGHEGHHIQDYKDSAGAYDARNSNLTPKQRGDINELRADRYTISLYRKLTGSSKQNPGPYDEHFRNRIDKLEQSLKGVKYH